MALEFLAFFVFTHLLLFHSAEETKRYCHDFQCGNIGFLSFPFHNITYPKCGLCTVNCSSKSQTIQFSRGSWLQIKNISQAGVVSINDTRIADLLKNRKCDVFDDLTLPIHSYVDYKFDESMYLNVTKCEKSVRVKPPRNFKNTSCKGYDFYYSVSNYIWAPPRCSVIRLPRRRNKTSDDLLTMLTAEFSVRVKTEPECYKCYFTYKGQCEDDKGKFNCSVPMREQKGSGQTTKSLKGLDSGQTTTKLLKGLGIGVGSTILISIFSIFVFKWYKKKKIQLGTNRDLLSSKSDLDGGSAYFGVSVFSHRELEEATNNFDSEKKLGDGGFGIVYYGKLRDGREVAVKRLFEHNYKRVQQFMNEIQILTLLRHKNLVTLYGCTSRRSHELLLVYEYIPNGTVAEHLHGDPTKSSLLTWNIRMNIALETASALAYLHASDIIHRDVKSNNILLDNNFCVKVADFGLSRLFPIDVTHVSTAPQGTPGYVDPEYYECYQLTSKSDVYSFGVVLIELISSMPAVDISRHRHEINLSRYAIHKIQKCEFDELIDSCLGYKSDKEVMRMTTSVAELAFRCLQQDKEMRPSMQEVVEELQIIQSGDYRSDHEKTGELTKKTEKHISRDCDFEKRILESNDSQTQRVTTQPSPEYDDVSLLENVKLPPSSPISVTAKWISTNTTPNNIST